MRFLLLQIRNQDDPMRDQEVGVFARALGVGREAIPVLDVLHERITPQRLEANDVVLIGGSGDYSAHGSEPWLMQALDGMRLIYETRVPLFASCWGFQALARALGGKVIHDPQRAELGTHELRLTEAGRRDPLFGTLPETFAGQMGHEDHVVELPPGAVLLASSQRVENQAYTFPDRPIYATQFHTELNVDDLKQRVRQYPEYLEVVTGMTLEKFCAQTYETPQCAALIGKFVNLVAEGALNGREKSS